MGGKNHYKSNVSWIIKSKSSLYKAQVLYLFYIIIKSANMKPFNFYLHDQDFCKGTSIQIITMKPKLQPTHQPFADLGLEILY